MIPAFRAIEPGPFVTVQDAGRFGWKRFGVSAAGAIDIRGLHAANALVGNPGLTGALEFAYSGGTWRVDAESCRVAVAGGAFRITVDDRPMPAWTSFVIRRGQMLRLDGAANAIWGYLAVAGGFDVPETLGSVSTHRRSGIGGTGISAGDALPLRALRAAPGPEHHLPAWSVDDPGMVRLLLGPQDDRFTDEAVHTLLTRPFTVTVRSDRLGYRLIGDRLAHRGSSDIISDGVVPGSIQVPGDGYPIILMPDSQPPGGYPKIGTVLSVDLPRVAQTRPGAELHFRLTTVVQAHLLRRRFIEWLAGMPARRTAMPPAP